MALPGLTIDGDSVALRVRLQPGASKTEFAGEHDGRLKLRVKAKPVQGAANKAAAEFLAKAAGVAKSRVELTHGAASRDKTFRIAADDPRQAAERLTKAAR